MGNSRYDRGRDMRGQHSWDEDRSPRSERDERGFFERAGDEVSSWFGDDEAQRRREMDERRYRESEGRLPSMSDDHHQRHERGAQPRDEGPRRSSAGRGMSGPPYGERFGPGHAYHEDRFDRGSSQREHMRQRDSIGAMGGVHDPHYAEWRNRQINELDRDYDEYRRENQSRFESDFSNWRNTRQSKRQLLGSIREKMSVVGADEQPVGTVDKVLRDRVILTKEGSADGQHHSISCGMIDRVEGDRVILDKNADEAKRSMGSEIRDRALFERDDDGEPGPHILNRSFSGTY